MDKASVFEPGFPRANKRSTVLAYVAVWLVLKTLSPELVRASGYEFEGVGARQVARAGAATADAEDWTATYWNPANIVRATQKTGREFGIEIFGGLAHSQDPNSLSALPVGAIFSKDSLSSHFVLGALGGIVPLGNKAGFGFSVYTPLLQGVKFQDRSSTGIGVDHKGSAGIITSNISLSLEFSPQFSAGAGLNTHYGVIHSETTLTDVPPLTDTLSSKLDADGFGLEGVFGLRYDPKHWLSLGAALRTGSILSLKGTASANSKIFPAESGRLGYTLKHPPTTDLGVALRPTSSLTLTLDLHQTYWKGFSNKLDYTPGGLLLATNPNTFQWRDTWKLRFGSRWKVTEGRELLGGYSYDRPSIDPGSLDFATSIDVPMHRFYGGIAQRLNRALETVLGAVAGFGERSEGTLRYKVSGWQLMLETRLHL